MQMIDLADLKPKAQRRALVGLAGMFRSIAEHGEDEDVEMVLEHLQNGCLDPIQDEYGDFFGTEGWERWVG